MSASLAPFRLMELLHLARLRNASDVHAAAGMMPALRIDGDLQAQTGAPLTSQEIEAMAADLLDGAALARLMADGDVSVGRHDGDAGFMRVHAYRGYGGIALAIRLLPGRAPALESLHLPAVVDVLAARSQGLIIFAGPTGSGKSTALAAVLDRINRTRARHIVTIEDPIEYLHRPERSTIVQREIGKDVPSFAQAAYGALRSDPDVILIGEMRDSATMHAALTAAETGHLVLTTLHTGDAPQTIDRITGSFSGEMQAQMRVQLAQTLAGVVCMRLLRRASAPGRRCAAEVLVATDAVRNLMREGKAHQLRNSIATGRAAGMQTLESHLNDLVARGEVSLEAARSATDRPNEIRTPLGSAS